VDTKQEAKTGLVQVLELTGKKGTSRKPKKGGLEELQGGTQKSKIGRQGKNLGSKGIANVDGKEGARP